MDESSKIAPSKMFGRLRMYVYVVEIVQHCLRATVCIQPGRLSAT